MSQVIEEARAGYEQAKDELLTNFAKVPDDRVNWSPAPTARTPVEIVAHCAEAVGHLTEMMHGKPFGPPRTAEADRTFRENEKSFTSREQALTAFDQSSKTFLALLDSLDPADLDVMRPLPFGMGQAPMSVMVTLPAMHTRSHIPQLEYLQTCYGDRTWLI
jgi:hypothetical protein